MGEVIGGGRFSGKVNASIGSSGGGDDGGNMEARIAKLEAHADHIQSDVAEIKSDTRELKGKIEQVKDLLHSDFRTLVYLGIAVAVFILGALVAGYFRLTDQTTAVADKVTQAQVVLQHISDALPAARKK